MSERWKVFLLEHPHALEPPCDIRETRTVGELLQHIVTVEQRYAQCLAGAEETPYDEIPFDTAEEIDRTHNRAMSLLSELHDRGESFWDKWIQFTTRSGRAIELPRRIVFVHLLMHSVRHYAQLATILRQHGHPVDFAMDYIIMHAA